jgi:hypothetical protein
MTGTSVTDDGRDAAWVSVRTTFAPDALRAFLLADVERLFRINPFLEFDEWRPLGNGQVAVRLRNLSNGKALATTIEIVPWPDGLTVRYTDGLKAETAFRVEAADGGAQLVVTENYGRLPPDERQRRLDEVDRSLVPWGNALWRYLRAWRRWSWCGPWRWYMARVWQRMTPSARRIVFLLWVVSAIEFAAFLFVAAVFVLETS